jgi:hypothetical protein
MTVPSSCSIKSAEATTSDVMRAEPKTLPFACSAGRASDELQPAKAGLAMAADHQMIMHDDAKGLGDGDDILRHADIGG